jgi:hypothetical protein
MALTGGCSCSAIRYTVDADPIANYLCHCTDCQRASGGPYAACVMVPAQALRIDRGEPRRYERLAESGNLVVLEFCGECGSTLFSNSPSRPEWRVLRAGCLDDRSSVAPNLHIWVDSALPWAIPDDGSPRLAQGPGSESR